MAHKKIGNRVFVDWETGDPEGDRKFLFTAYRDFLRELINEIETNRETPSEIKSILDKWSVNVDLEVDDFPRIWIKRPEKDKG